MKQFIRDYFTFNKRERNGVFILLAIIFLQLVYLDISSHFVTVESEDDAAFKKEVETFMASLKDAPADSNEPARPELAEDVLNAERFDFDPNQLPDNDWKRLGLSEKQVRTIRNYLLKGGKFRKKEDLKKMYCIREALYVSLEPYIRIKTAEESRPVLVSEKLPVVASGKPSQTLVELNTADSAQLTGLKGIGPFFAKTIIKYRNLLGGFNSKEQLMEIWKFDADKYTAIENYVTVDNSKIRKININTCEAAELRGVYINWNVANGIVNYRKQHGSFQTVDDIRKTDLVDEETYRKIVPYLVTE